MVHSGPVLEAEKGEKDSPLLPFSGDGVPGATKTTMPWKERRAQRRTSFSQIIRLFFSFSFFSPLSHFLPGG